MLLEYFVLHTDGDGAVVPQVLFDARIRDPFISQRLEVIDHAGAVLLFVRDQLIGHFVVVIRLDDSVFRVVFSPFAHEKRGEVSPRPYPVTRTKPLWHSRYGYGRQASFPHASRS